MDKYILTGPSALTKTQDNFQPVNPNQVKVKVTYLSFSNYDALVHNGEFKLNYPIVPGRFAVGIVTEVGEACTQVKKGDRVHLISCRPCGHCLPCKRGNPAGCTDIKIVGRHRNGFMRDFVVLNETDVAPLPDTIDDISALCIEIVALAEAIFDKANLTAGQKVAIVGGNLVGNIVAQVMRYHKVIPIVIDNNAKNLEIAGHCGVPFTFPADDDLQTNVLNATAGTLCDGAIHLLDSRLNPDMAIRCLADGKTLLLAGFTNEHFAISTQELVDRSLCFRGVTHGYGYTDAAISLIQHDGLDLSNFDVQIRNDQDVLGYVSELLAQNYRGCVLNVLKMIL